MRKGTVRFIFILALVAVSFMLSACKQQEQERFEVSIVKPQEGIVSFEVFHENTLINDKDLIYKDSILTINWQLIEGYDAVLYLNDEESSLVSGETIRLIGDIEIKLTVEIKQYRVNYSVQAESFKLFLGEVQLENGAKVAHGSVLSAQWAKNEDYFYTVSVPKGKNLIFSQVDCQFEVVEDTELFIFSRRHYAVEISAQAGIKNASLKADESIITSEGRLFECEAKLFFEVEGGYLFDVFINGEQIEIESGATISIDRDTLIEFFTERVYSIDIEIDQQLLQYLSITDKNGVPISPPFKSGQSVKIEWKTDLYRAELCFFPDKFVDYGQFFLLESIEDDFLLAVTTIRQHKLSVKNTYDSVLIDGEQRTNGDVIYYDDGARVSVEIESELFATALINNTEADLDFNGQKSSFSFEMQGETELEITLFCLVNIVSLDGFDGLNVMSGGESVVDGQYLAYGDNVLVDFTPNEGYFLYIDLILQSQNQLYRQLTRDILIEVRFEATQTMVDVEIDFDAHYLEWFEIRVLDNNEVVFRQEIDSEGSVNAQLPDDLQLVFVLSYSGALVYCDELPLLSEFYASEGQKFSIISGVLVELVGLFNNIQCYDGKQYWQVISGHHFPVGAEIIITYDRYDYIELYINSVLVHVAVERFVYSFTLVEDVVVTLRLI